ncbi:MAG TPA: phage tail sheath C-terminal domain-containing protein [Longimicrobiales bacterium]|nr:phage tail sheath C-terminal domain-containing protein [Longimicrobiales bacterium]
MAMMTPGVYIVEKDAFPNSVVEVATAVPAFIGYTAKHDDKGQDLRLKPTKVTSLAEYAGYFGGAPKLAGLYSLTGDQPEGLDNGPPNPVVTLPDGPLYLHRKEGSRRYMYYGMRSFYQNGGGPCYIVSLGTYEDKLSKDDFVAGIAELLKEQEPTMLVFPDAVLLEAAECLEVQQVALDHCAKTQSRFTIADVPQGYLSKKDCINDFREGTTSDNRRYGAAYYPWIETTVVSAADSELTFQVLDKGAEAIGKILADELVDPKTKEPVKEAIDKLMAGVNEADSGTKVSTAHDGLIAASKRFAEVMKQVRVDVNRLPPSATMAGVYTRVDNSRGVWKAPANVGLTGVVRPSVNITHDDQEDLNVHVTGKSVNAIRSFIGEGTLVWGARTLDGNSLDWRYIQVRRTMIMLEQSIKLATKAYVFEANDANTWVTLKSMIRNFLTGIWKRGGLAGASPDAAFSVHVGLGETMTPEDILEGILRVTVLVAPTRPAEFIEITFQQKMQES